MESAVELEEIVDGRIQAEPTERRAIREKSWYVNMVKRKLSVTQEQEERLAVLFSKRFLRMDGGARAACDER